MNETLQFEADTQIHAHFPTNDAAAEFLEQVRLWNSVAGLPQIRVCSTAGWSGVVLRSVVSARRGMVRLVEAFGGVAAGEPRARSAETER
jgi:hypothetical protein